MTHFQKRQKPPILRTYVHMSRSTATFLLYNTGQWQRLVELKGKEFVFPPKIGNGRRKTGGALSLSPLSLYRFPPPAESTLCVHFVMCMYVSTVLYMYHICTWYVDNSTVPNDTIIPSSSTVVQYTKQYAKSPLL